MHRIIAAMAVCLITAGCAVGVTHRYDSVTVSIDRQSNSIIAVAVHDQRPYVVNGNKSPNFVGLSRGGFANPFDVTTDSKKPLATDFTASIVASLRAGGATAMAVIVSPQDSGETARKILLATKAGRYILVTLNEWKADTYMNTALHYDILLSVHDGNGIKRASKRLKGKDNLGGDAFNPPGHSRKAIPAAYKRKLEALFRDPLIKAAL